MRVALIDPISTGHHVPYARGIAKGLRNAGHEPYAVGSAAWCASLSDLAQVVPLDWAPRGSASYFERQADSRHFYRLAFFACESNGINIAHLLYVDGALSALVRVGIPIGMKVISTLHWYPFLGLSVRQPKQALKALQVVAASWLLDRAGGNLVVHSIAAKKRLSRVGVSRVHAIDYPSAVSCFDVDEIGRETQRKRLGLSPDERLLLCFGGTRHDKGVDIAISSLAGTDRRTRLLVAGVEQDFDRRLLLELAEAHRVENQLLLQLEHVPEGDVVSLFSAADAVLLPYRPVFKGQSGPLAIAGSMGIPVIAADVPVLAETVTRFGLGRLFPAGDGVALNKLLREELPRIAEPEHRRFAAACDSANFEAGIVRIYEGVCAPARGPELSRELSE